MDKKLLLAILSEHAAPFRESHVVRVLQRELTAASIPFFQDPGGNLVLGAKNKEEYLAKINTSVREPVRLFIAHMDHPGFHGVKWKKKGLLEVKWFGGSPRRFLTGARVWIQTDEGDFHYGIMKSAKLNKSKSAIESAVVSSDRDLPAEKLYGGFGFKAPVWQSGKKYYTKAADDLVGTFAIVSLAKKLYAKGDGGKNFIGLLTRAEEVGFIGCINHFELGWILEAKRKVIGVSLETSRTLPGALIGKGPVLRLGDRAGTFDSGALSVFQEVAQKVLPDKFQKRIMDGGTCEGTVSMAYGFPTVGISVPLGNYHNQSFEGGPGSRGEWGPAPEFVHEDDIEGMLRLCEGLLTDGLAWDSPFAKKVGQFKEWQANYASLMADIPG